VPQTSTADFGHVILQEQKIIFVEVLLQFVLTWNFCRQPIVRDGNFATRQVCVFRMQQHSDVGAGAAGGASALSKVLICQKCGQKSFEIF